MIPPEWPRRTLRQALAVQRRRRATRGGVVKAHVVPCELIEGGACTCNPRSYVLRATR